MSTKTNFKRVALVAVVALGAGVLATSPATAAAPDNNAVGTGNVATGAGVLNIATNPSITGDALTIVTTIANQTSVGLLANSTTQSTSSLTSTATMRADGEIVFYYTGATQDAATSFVVSGATISDSTITATTAIKNLNAARTKLVAADITVPLVASFAVTPNAGVTSFTVEAYDAAATSIGTATQAGDAGIQLAAIQAGSVSTGTLMQRYLVTVATTSASGVYSADDSYVQVQENTASVLAAPDTNADEVIASATASYPTASPSMIGNSSGVGYVSFNLLDAYGVSLSGKGALVVSATNGAGVSLGANDAAYNAATSVTLLTAVSNYASGSVTVARPAAMAGKGFSTTVTISWNGAVVGTKSLTFLGEVASLVATPRRIGSTKAGVSNADSFRVTYADSAGNALIGLAAPVAATTAISSTTTSVVGASVVTPATATTAALGTLTCTAGASDYIAGGTANLQLQHVNTLSGTIVKSNVFAASCQGNAYSYTAGFDKTTYTPGSIATLTITFKDRDGDLANGFDVVGTTASLIAIVGGPSATAVTIPADQDKPDSGTGLAGTKTYQFIVGATEGDFQAVVSVPVVNGRGNSAQTNQTVAYSVKASSSSVSMADVLKAIVSLIASINKQIAALQKALLKK
jgi:hypothetical protein